MFGYIGQTRYIHSFLVEFCAKNQNLRKGHARWEMGRDEIIYGFAVWWSCDLAPGISLSTAPAAPKTHWEQLYFPVRKPLAARGGDRLAIALTSHSSYESGTDLRWEVVLQTREGRIKHAQVMDLRKGYL